MFRLALLSILSATAAAKGFTPVRRLEDDGDYAWMSGYTVLYENCFHSDSLVAFRLCPENDKCEQGCSGGAQYLTDLAFFIDAYTEAQLGAHEYACEMARENCAYDDDENEYLCYEEAGLQDCEDKNEDENGFNLQEALECMEIDDGYYVGPYCSEDNYNLYLGVFTDEDCTEAADVEVYEKLTGYELPYASETIVSNSCANCREHGAQQDQNEGDAEDEDDVLEQCEELYAASSKCEQDLDVDNPDLSACDYLEELQENEKVSTGQPKESKSYSARTIWFSVLGALAVVACCAGSAWYGWRSKNQDAGMKPAKQPLV